MNSSFSFLCRAVPAFGSIVIALHSSSSFALDNFAKHQLDHASGQFRAATVLSGSQLAGKSRLGEDFSCRLVGSGEITQMKTAVASIRIELQGNNVVIEQSGGSGETVTLAPPSMAFASSGTGGLAIRSLGGAHGPGTVIMELYVSEEMIAKGKAAAKISEAEARSLAEMLRASIPSVADQKGRALGYLICSPLLN